MLPKIHINQIFSQFHARSDSLQDLEIATQEDDEHALHNHEWMAK